jgi:hypothetical protein
VREVAPPPNEVDPIALEAADSELVIQNCDVDKADAILVIEITIPGDIKKDERRFPLKRGRPEPVVFGPDGSCTFSFDLGVNVLFAHGLTEDGLSCCYGGYVGVGGLSPNKVVVNLSLYWSARDKWGDLEEAIEVTWLATANKDFGNGARVQAYFTKPVKEASAAAVWVTPGPQGGL